MVSGFSSGCLLPTTAAPIVPLPLFVLACPTVCRPSGWRSRRNGSRRSSPYVRIVSFRTTPRFRGGFHPVSRVTSRNAAFCRLTIKMLCQVSPSTVHAKARRVARIKGYLSYQVSLNFRGFKDHGNASMASNVRVPRDSIQAAGVVGGVANHLCVANVFESHPTIVPSVTTFSKRFVIRFRPSDLHFIRHPSHVTTPNGVRPNFTFHRRFLTRVNFPANGIKFRLFRGFFNCNSHFKEVIIRRLLSHRNPVFRFLHVNMSGNHAVKIAVTIFRRCLISRLQVPGALPTFSLFLLRRLLIVRGPDHSPRVESSVINHFPSQLT